MAHEIQIGSFKVGAGNRPFLIAGPCVIESEQLVLETAARTDLVLLIRRTVRPGGSASGFDSPAASLQDWFEHLTGSWKKQRPWRRKSREETSKSAQAIGRF